MLKVPINEILTYADTCYISMSCACEFLVYGGEESTADRFVKKKKKLFLNVFQVTNADYIV